jgi:hypothetical protein
MKLNNLGVLLLGIWLVASGLVAILSLSFTGSTTILGLLALAAGVLILIGARNLPNRLGMFLLAIWLIITGLLPLINLSFEGISVVMGVLALAAGVLLLLRR